VKLEHEGYHYQIPYRGEGASGLGKPLKSILHGDPALRIYTASIAPKGIECAAEVADGVFPVWMNPERFDLFEESLENIPVVRAMPNTPSAVDLGMTAYTCGSHVDDDHHARAKLVLGSVGETLELSEDLLDAVTAVSGTGPAYVFLLAESLIEAAIREGLPHHAAERLVHQTLRGSGELLSTSDKSAFRLRGEVTSPGGTTAAAMHVLEDGGFRALVEDAVRAAAQRSRDLGDKASER